MIGIALESYFEIVGASASSGSRPRTRSIRVRTSSSAAFRSVPQRKLRRMLLEPSWDVELSWSNEATALRLCSSGRVTSCSISSGPTPAYPTRTLIVGMLMSGSRSTGRRVSEIPPSRTMTQQIIAIVIGRRMDIAGMLISLPHTTLARSGLPQLNCQLGRSGPTSLTDWLATSAEPSPPVHAGRHVRLRSAQGHPAPRSVPDRPGRSGRRRAGPRRRS